MKAENLSNKLMTAGSFFGLASLYNLENIQESSLLIMVSALCFAGSTFKNQYKNNKTSKVLNIGSYALTVSAMPFLLIQNTELVYILLGASIISASSANLIRAISDKNAYSIIQNNSVKSKR